MSATTRPESFQIRPLVQSDFHALLSHDWAPIIQERDTIYLFLTQDHASTCFVAEDEGGDAIGYVIAARSADGRSAFVFHLHVRCDRRGCGVGGALMKRFEADALESGIETIWLLAGGRACRFYDRIGYAQHPGLLHPDVARHVKDVKSSSVLVKKLAPAGRSRVGGKAQEA